MDLSIHLKCPYCSEFYPIVPHPDAKRHDAYEHGCPAPLTTFGGDDDGLVDGVTQPQCFSCGPLDDLSSFSRSQLRKAECGEPARCEDCISVSKIERFIDYQAVATISIHEELMDVVSKGDVARVTELLSLGADVNHIRQAWVIDKNRPSRAFYSDGTAVPEEDSGDLQPTTPLKLVGFRISDSCLSDNALVAFKEIASILLSSGARAAPALRHMEGRYGAFDPDAYVNGGTFAEIFAMIHAAAQRQNFP